ncbi:sigma-70 family RNA polymerase sigma factor [Armatimonas rosea]|uniref:RNA polymerase sigma-70 factor (ECF subfamily) n=1 Tax=Armatimonas rosea TaxID=685828 RepID=A0A7W9STB3_ARMRO|nr:sigma-70 family RNA polymerase sigma factor [Armatimonas rosea]MBB6052462.1 RNA polymerase sigma-70 factor (ECF subfamily) [Armatimonas rosea]
MILTPLEEKQLIERSRRGDVAAFDKLVRRYERTVYNVAYRLSGSHDDASDIAQEAFVRAWNNLKSFRGEAQFSTWIHRIVTNVFLDDRKKKRSRPTTSLDESMELDENTVTRQFEDASPGPEALMEGEERRMILEKAIHTLPEAQRVMIVMYHNQGLAYEEIADLTQLPIGTVKSRLNRARLALRDRLGKVAELFGIYESPTLQ